VPRASLPPAGQDEWYAFDLVGLRAVEDGGRELGRVTAVEPGVANDVLVLEDGTLLPFVQACVGDIDLAAGTIDIASGFAEPD
jgi:16S rRNA processing protein RimM